VNPKEEFEIWLVEGKTPISNSWEPVFSFGNSNEDIPRIVWCRYLSKEDAQRAAKFMLENNSMNIDLDNPSVVYRAAKYLRIEP
jgi:hypothetical protein